MNWDTVHTLEEQRYVTVQKHPTAELWIINYTEKCQYDGYWNEETMQCRGLIVDAEFNIKARPFKKFFNLDEHLSKNLSELPWSLPYTIMEKMDGSLGILYWIEEEPFIATRGSFSSDQAVKANELLRTRYKDAPLDKRYTYLFEIIYKQNRIVVDYKEREELVLLSLIETETGEEFPPPKNDWFPIPIVYPADTPREMLKVLCPNDGSCEGIVIRFFDGTRVKIKTEEYVRLHRLLTQVSSYAIWELLKEGSNIDELIDNVPDEFFAWVKETKEALEGRFNRLLQEATELSQEVKDLSRKEAAHIILQHEKPVSTAAFLLLDKKNKQAVDAIWKAIKPEYERPFRKDEEI